MEPNHNTYQPPAELPQPQEAGQTQGSEVASAPERSMQPPVSPGGQQALQPVAPLPAVPPAGPGPSQSAPTAAMASTDTNNLIADDVDLIEKEWVVKAKAIVAKTKNDPYEQNRAMNEVKADYMKKRYNKDLKVSSEN